MYINSHNPRIVYKVRTIKSIAVSSRGRESYLPVRPGNAYERAVPHPKICLSTPLQRAGCRPFIFAPSPFVQAK